MSVVCFRRSRGPVYVVQHTGNDLHWYAALGHPGGNGASQIVSCEIKPQASRQLFKTQGSDLNIGGGAAGLSLYLEV